jgi:thymidylate synthase ThyX
MSHTNGYDKLKVTLVQKTEEPFALIWRSFRQTWIHLQNKEYDSCDDECSQAIDDVLAGLALPVPLEALQLELRIEGLSRVALAQITRGRIGHAFVVESQMPQHISHQVVLPLNIAQSQFAERAKQLIENTQQLYDDMYDSGIPPQDCRYLISHAQTCSLTWHVNYTALRGFFAMRAENSLTDELNLLCRLIRRDLLSDNCLQWRRLASQLDCIGAKQHKALMIDRVYGNALSRYPCANERVQEATDNADYDFALSAWWAELQRLPADLLFPDEAEAIQHYAAMQ